VSQPVRASKTCWHPLSLQQLTPNKFVGVVNNILSGRFSLLPGTLHGAGNGSADLRGYRAEFRT
jgi:hypothetical protein